MARANNINALKKWVKENGAWNKSSNLVTCKNCNKVFHAPPSGNRKYCSNECYRSSDRARGIESHNWKGGKPRCMDCGKILAGYQSKRCKVCMGNHMSGNGCHL